MNTSLHLEFSGNCDAAFSYYESVFGTKRPMTMKWGEAPEGMACPAGAENLVMHTSLPLGGITLMGADAPPGHAKGFGGFDICVESPDEAEVHRLFAALSDGGSVRMQLTPTFWSPLFGMCTDQFGVNWMVTVPGKPA